MMKGKAAADGGAIGRKVPPELHAGSDESGRPFIASREKERNLPAGCGAGEGLRVPVPLRVHRYYAWLFRQNGAQIGGEIGQAMLAFAKNPNDIKAAARIAEDPDYNGILRTTCVATLLSPGHATNALPHRADANINCRIFPGTTPEQVRDKLAEVIGDPEVNVTPHGHRSDIPKGPPPLTPRLFGPGG